MSEEYKNGFDAGFDFAKKNWDPQTGRQTKEFPKRFVHRGNVWSCGFGEGLISGRSELMTMTFGKFKSIHWSNGNAVVAY